MIPVDDVFLAVVKAFTKDESLKAKINMHNINEWRERFPDLWNTVQEKYFELHDTLFDSTTNSMRSIDILTDEQKQVFAEFLPDQGDAMAINTGFVLIDSDESGGFEPDDVIDGIIEFIGEIFSFFTS